MRVRRLVLACCALLLPACSREPSLQQLLDGDVRIPEAERVAVQALFQDQPAREVALVLDEVSWLQGLGVRVVDGHVVGLALVGDPTAAPTQSAQASPPSASAPHPLAALLQLRSLRVKRAPWRDFRALGALPALETLSLEFSSLESLEGLAACCSRLRRLDISHGTVDDLSPLRGLDSLEELRLAQLDLVDLTTAPALPKLRALVLDGGPLASLDGLDAFAGLQELTLFGAKQLTSLDSLSSLQPAALSALREFELHQTKVAYLGGLPPLPSLERLETSDNALLRVQLPTRAEDLPRLRQLEIHEADLVSVELGQLPSLESVDLRGDGSLFDQGRLHRLVIASQPKLSQIDLRRNHIQDLGGVEPQPSLWQLRLDRNPIADLAPLADGFPALRHISVRRTRVAGLPQAMEDAGVVLTQEPGEVEANAWEAVLRQAFEAQKDSFVETLPSRGGGLHRLKARCSYAASTFSTPQLNCSGSIQKLSGLVYLELVKVDPLSPAAGGPNTWPVRVTLRTRKGRARLYVKYEANFRATAEALSGYRDPDRPWFEWGDGAEEGDVVSGYAFAEATPGQPGSTSGEAHLLADRLVVWIEGEDAEGVDYVLESPNS